MKAKRVYEALDDVFVPKEDFEIEKDLKNLPLSKKHDLWMRGELDKKYQPLIFKFYDRMVKFFSEKKDWGFVNTPHPENEDAYSFAIILKNKHTVKVRYYNDEPKDVHVAVYSNHDRIHQEWVKTFKALTQIVNKYKNKK